MFKTSLRGAAENMELTWQASTFPSVYPAQSIRDVISPLYMQELLHLFVLIMGTGASLRVSGECAEEEDAEGSSFSTLGILIMSHYTCGTHINIIWSVTTASYPPPAVCIPTLISSTVCLLVAHSHTEASRQVWLYLCKGKMGWNSSLEAHNSDSLKLFWLHRIIKARLSCWLWNPQRLFQSWFVSVLSCNLRLRV